MFKILLISEGLENDDNDDGYQEWWPPWKEDCDIVQFGRQVVLHKQLKSSEYGQSCQDLVSLC